MRTFLIEDEDALCRYLAARTWSKDFVSAPEKELADKMAKEKRDAFMKKSWEAHAVIMANKCKTGGENPANKKKQLADNFSKTVVAEIKVG